MEKALKYPLQARRRVGVRIILAFLSPSITFKRD